MKDTALGTVHEFTNEDHFIPSNSVKEAGIPLDRGRHTPRQNERVSEHTRVGTGLTQVLSVAECQAGQSQDLECGSLLDLITHCGR